MGEIRMSIKYGLLKVGLTVGLTAGLVTGLSSLLTPDYDTSKVSQKISYAKPDGCAKVKDIRSNYNGIHVLCDSVDGDPVLYRKRSFEDSWIRIEVK